MFSKKGSKTKMNTVFNVQIGDKIRGNMEYLDIYIYTQ